MHKTCIIETEEGWLRKIKMDIYIYIYIYLNSEDEGKEEKGHRSVGCILMKAEDGVLLCKS
jgi:hypothetical protein